MHDIRNQKAPSTLQNLFIDNSRIHSYNTRSSTSGNFYIKSSRLEIGKKSFSRVGARVGNEIPQQLRGLPKKQFKNKLHTLLIDILKQHNDCIAINQITTSLKKYKL